MYEVNESSEDTDRECSLRHCEDSDSQNDPDCFNTVASFEEYQALNNAIRQATNIINTFDYYKMIDSIRAALLRCSEALSNSYAIINVVSESFKAVQSALKPLSTEITLVNCLSKSNWPLYLEVNDAMESDLLGLDTLESDVTLADEVGVIALKYLDQSWLEGVKRRWDSIDGLGKSERAILLSALGMHERKDYTACVAVLMCILDGLLKKLCGPSFATMEQDETKLFNFIAERYGLKPVEYGRGKKARHPNSRDYAILLIMRSECGILAFESITSYLVNVVLSHSDDEDLFAHNPLRNKICHGIQTNYGTLEHSLKAILITDIVLRLGSFLAE